MPTPFQAWASFVFESKTGNNYSFNDINSVRTRLNWRLLSFTSCYYEIMVLYKVISSTKQLNVYENDDGIRQLADVIESVFSE